MSIKDEDNIGRFQIDLNESSCLYFCGHFYESFKQKYTAKGATIIEGHIRQEVIEFCAECGKYLIKKFHKFDNLSDSFRKPGTTYIVYINIDISHK